MRVSLRSASSSNMPLNLGRWPRARAVRAGVLAAVTVLVTPLAASVVAPSIASAQPASPAVPTGPLDAKAQLAAGDKATKAKNWAAAIAAYSAAKAQNPSLEAMDGLANALYEKDDFGHAYEAYEDLIRMHVGKLAKDKRATAEKRLKELGQKSGPLTINGTEAEAEVALDGVLIGKLPIAKSMRVSAGEHKLRATKLGFNPFETAFTVTGNTAATVEVKLAAEVHKGKLKVHEADGKPVHVFVDGIDVGAAPWEGDVDPGVHDVVVRGPNVVSAPEKVTVDKNGLRDIELRASATLAKLKITVEGSPTAQIFLDGKPVGTGSFTAEIPAGTHKLSVTREGYQKFEDEVVLVERENVARTVVLNLSEEVKTGGDDKSARKLEGFYGGFGLMGLLLPAGNGSDVQETCAKRAAPVTDCSGGGAGTGGGLFFFAGHHWDPVGLELVFGGSFDQQSTKIAYSGSNLGVGGGLGPDPKRTEDFFIGRAGGFLLGRTRLSFQTNGVRGSFAVGVGASYRVSFLTRDTEGPAPLRDAFVSNSIGSFSPVLSLDASIAPRFGERISLPIGIMMLAESPNAKIFGDQVPRTDPEPSRQLAPGVGLSTPSYQLSAGPQVFLGLYVGLMFGP